MNEKIITPEQIAEAVRLKTGESISEGIKRLEALFYGHLWQTWEGGDCPVSADEMVDVKLRSGEILCGLADDFYWARWSLASDESSQDVVAYRKLHSQTATIG